MSDLMTDFHHLDVDNLDEVKRGLKIYTEQCLSQPQKLTMRRLFRDLMQLVEINRMLIDRVQHLEAMVGEMRE